MSITRRRFITTATATTTAALLGPTVARSARAADNKVNLTLPLPRQVVWQDCEVGAIFHFDMPQFAGDFTRNNATRKTFDPKLYNPTKLDTDQWVAAAKAMGARYAIFTATHFNGFMQWQSDLYPYGVKQASWRDGKGDVVKDFVESCRKADIKPGIYMSCYNNAWWKVKGHRVNYGKGGEGQAKFARNCENMFKELCTRYGDLMQIWFDGGNITPEDGGPDMLPIADKYQPNMVFYHSPQRSEHRWIGNEAGHASYPCWATMPGPEKDQGKFSRHRREWKPYLSKGDPNGPIWSPGMVDIVLRGRGNHQWFWRPNKDHTQYTTDQLMQMYDTSVGRNCNLIIGIVVDNHGLVPKPDVACMDEFGKAIHRRFAKPVAETHGTGKVVMLDLPRPQKIDHVTIMEDIAKGERVRKYAVEGLTSGNTWQPICDGISIGHKRIQQFKPIEVAKLRLRVTESLAEPIIRKLAVFHTAATS